tara:strand:- start:75 stop:455 length:381 start_codon:yes stop_codon:yes gene_type:complete
MALRVRGAGSRDIPYIQKLLDEYDFHLNMDKLELLMVAEDTETGDIIGVASLVTFLEATFMTDKSQPRAKRIEALKQCVEVSEKTIKSLGYDCYHAFATNDPIERIMVKRFGYVKAEGVNLIKWVD